MTEEMKKQTDAAQEDLAADNTAKETAEAVDTTAGTAETAADSAKTAESDTEASQNGNEGSETAEAGEGTSEGEAENGASEGETTEEAPEADAEDHDADAADDADQTDSSTDKGGGFFNKKKIKKLEEENANLTDRLKRSMAEFENFRKRSEKEKSQMYEIGAGDVLGKMLPVIDNFERGLASVSEENREDPIYTGMELIYKQMMTAITDLGVTPIEAVGQPFDPNLHNAVMHIEDESFDENVVAEEFQKGYRYRDSILRHSMVKVAN